VRDEYNDDLDDVGSGGGGLIAQLPNILWQRKWFIIFPILIGLLAAVAAIVILPAQYQSSAVLLVQSPSLPDEVIGNSKGDAINRRIESIRQQVINRPQLAALIESNKLYETERGRKPLSVIIEQMKEHIALESIDSEMGSPRPEDRTIAFRLSYIYSEPRNAQAIVQSLMERIVEINSTTNVAQSGQTVQFLTEQSTNLQRQITSLESQISSLNAQYGGILSRGGMPVLSNNSATYDIQIAELMRANQQLALQRDTAQSSSSRDPAVAAAEAQLAGARGTYADSHPDVKLARRRLEEAKQLAAQNVQKLPLENIDQQIAFNTNQIAALRSAKSGEQSQIAASVGAQAKAPAVQQQAEQMQQKLEGLYKQYEGISQRMMTAEAGARAAEEQMGERLVVIDPPVVADEPVSPDRLLIMGLGLGSGIGLGFLLALLVEIFLQPIRTPAAISAITGQHTLALVPLIEMRHKKHKGSFRSVWHRLFRRST
jgi:polysaccharide biosynthesis transport protein